MLELLTPEQKSYLIGFLQGDGHHSESTRNRGKISIEISDRDIDILDKLEEILSSYIKVSRSHRTRKTNFSECASLCSLTLFDWAFRIEIKEFVPVGKKSEIIKPPNTEYNDKHYIRGLIDADGSLGFKKTGEPFLSLVTSSESIKEYIVDSIKKVIGVEKRLNRNKRDNVYNIGVGNEDAMLYSEWLYEDATIFLNRKRDKYKEIQKWVRILRPKRPENHKKWLDWEDIVVFSDKTIEDKCLLLSRSSQSVKMRYWRLKQHNK